MLRNPELRRALLVGGLLTFLASAAAMSLSGWQAACVALALGTVLLVLYGVELCCRYRAMARLAADIDAVLHGSGDIHLADYGEGEVSLLRSEVRKMTLRLREQSAQLEKEKLQLADAMADISHQMRTPLTAVNLLLTSLAGHVDEESRGDVRALRRQVARMDWLVESLLKMPERRASARKPFHFRPCWRGRRSRLPSAWSCAASSCRSRLPGTSAVIPRGRRRPSATF